MTIKAEPYTHDPSWGASTYSPVVYENTTRGDMNERIMGYPIKDLLVLAESLRLNGIRPEQVTEHTLDIQMAQNAVMNGLKEQVLKMFEGRAE